MTLKLTRVLLALVAVGVLVAAAPDEVRAADAEYHHVHITSSAPPESVRWYSRHLDCAPIADRDDTADCHGVEVTFVPQPTMGSTQGTGVNHIGFSYPDLTAKMAELEDIGVRGSGVRLQRFPDGSTVRDVPGLFKIGFIFDPWGTRIELVEDPEYARIPPRAPQRQRPRCHPGVVSRTMMGGEPASSERAASTMACGSTATSGSWCRRYPEGTPGTTVEPRDRPCRLHR